MKTIKNHVLTGEQLNQITKIERFQGAFETTKFQRSALVESLKKTSIITSSGASTRIEGAILADEQVKELIEKGCEINDMSSRSEREVAGYVKALNYIYENFDQLNISEKTIRELHQLLTGELTEDQLPSTQRGAYKNVPNDVVEQDQATGKIIKVWFKTAPPGPETETAMADLIFDYEQMKKGKECQFLILIASFVVHFLAIHPFRDGNGRLSRLLTTLLLLKNEYKWAQYTSHEKVIEDNKEGYYISLRKTQSTFHEEAQYNDWINYFLKILTVQTDFLNSKLIHKSPASVMNENEKQVYSIIETEEECTISFILESIEMSRAGLKDLLKRLVEKGIIKKQGQGRGTTYIIS
jgi:Fic family protein